MAEGEEKTESATPRRRTDARKKGQVVKSQELCSLAVMFAVVLAMPALGSNTSSVIHNFFVNTWMHINYNVFTPAVGIQIGTSLVLTLVRAVGPLVAVAMVVGVTASVAQTGPVLAFERLRPDFNRLNPLQGLKHVFSLPSTVELGKTVFKIVLVGYICYLTINQGYTRLILLSRAGMYEGLAFVGEIVHQMLQRVIAVILVMSALDYAFQRYNYEKSIRMTRTEVRQEFKQSEGDPMLKSRMKAKMRQMARKRMMESVPTADVIVTNPTHFAVAMKYDTDKMRAPIVVAKGQDLIALKIREIAQYNDVPIVENPPLARTLYRQVEIGREIPPDMYAAVAEVMAFVFRVNAARRERMSRSARR